MVDPPTTSLYAQTGCRLTLAETINTLYMHKQGQGHNRLTLVVLHGNSDYGQWLTPPEISLYAQIGCSLKLVETMTQKI